MPKVSVVIPSYNRANYLDVAATSVLVQTYRDLELIIVDDGSQDRTWEICGRLCEQDHRVRYIPQENKGLPGARNTGICAARGEYIALLDADDFWEPTKLAKQLAIAEQAASIGLIFCDYVCVDEAGRTWPPVYCDNVGQTTYEDLLYYNVIHGSASAVLIRRECFDRVGLFDESLRSLEDWDMWLRIAQWYKCAKVHEVLTYLLQHSGQMQRKSQVMADSHLALVRKIARSMPLEYKHQLAKIKWHHQLVAAELYCIETPRKACHALHLAIWSWPRGVLSPRTWYVFVLSLAGPFYPQANAIGLVLRQWLRRHFELGTVTGWREPRPR